MTTPSASDSHVAEVLTDFAVQYANNADDFKADQLAPSIASSKKAIRFWSYDKAPWFTDEMQKRGEGADVPMSGYTLTNTLMEADVWSLGKPIDDQVEDNEDEPLDSEEDATAFLMHKERIKREAAFAAACLATSKWSLDVTAGTDASDYTTNVVAEWNDSDSNPLVDIATYKTRMKLSTGLDPNVLVLGRQVWDIVKNHADIVALVNGGATTLNPAKVTLQNVAALFELEEIVVMNAVKNTAASPVAMTGAFIAGKHGLLMHRNMNAGRKGATAVKTMTWQRPGADARGFRLLKSQKNIHVKLIEVESNFVHKIMSSDLGIFFSALVA